VLQQLRISIGTTWRYARADGTATVDADLRSYKEWLNQLKTGPVDGFTLPWPAYRSTFWRGVFGGPYDFIDTRTLVAALVPGRREGDRDGAHNGALVPRLEVLWHPFAATALAHYQLDPADDGPADDTAVATRLDDFLRQPSTAAGRQLRDGVNASELPPRPGTDFTGDQAAPVQCSTFMVVSALHQEAPDPKAVAAGLALLFQAASTDAEALRDPGGAVAVRSGRVGLVLPRNSFKAGMHLRCLHHNQALLLAQIESLASVLSGPASVAAERYRPMAALMLNCLYRRAPHPATGSVYKARLSELWVAHRGLAPKINGAATTLDNPPPPLPQ
jgi:hypothetical protein